ncbi:MAG: fibro-slime domain-containing protein [Polyangiaceae bacterium]
MGQSFLLKLLSSVPRRDRGIHSALRVSCLALPALFAGLVACGGSSAEAQVDGTAGPASQGNGQAGLPELMLPGPEGGTGGVGSSGGAGGEPGSYMLPAGFTKGQLGGYKLGSAIDGIVGAAGEAAGGASGSGCGTQILGVVRDFKGANEPDGHPDFEAFSGSDASEGIVKPVLGADQKPEYAAMGAFKDRRNGQQTTSKMAFDQWYRATAGVNKPYVVYFYFQPNPDKAGVLTFQSTAFFPLDGQGWGNSCAEADAECPKQAHNFGFTTEVHTQFNYKGKETFAFTGDDDLWVFINHKLAIDLGGLHSQTSKTVSLDAEAQKLGIVIGGTYDLDLFHAERHTNASNFRVDTNLAFTNCGTIIEEPPVK